MHRHLAGLAPESVIEYRIRTKTGQTLWLRGKGKVVERDTTGKPLRMVGIISDITAEKQTALELLASEARLRANIECTPNVAIQWFDREARVRYWNPASATLYGWSASEALGRTLGELILAPDRAGDFRAILAEIEAKGRPFGPHEIETRHRNGETRWVLSTVFSFPADDGQDAFACMDVDITARKAAEAELENYRHHLEDLVNERTLALEKARDAAEAASRAKGTFLANMSHEIRTPLNAILGMARLVRREGLTDTQTQRMDQLETASNHLLEIINSILDLSKIEAGKLVLEQEPVRLKALADNVADMLRPRAQRQGIALAVECESPEYGLMGDATKLQQGILNYVANAIKFTPSGTVTLRIRVVEDDEFSALVRVEVIDTGIGIAPDALARLFSAFEQADNSLTRKYGGTGLGLAITQSIARQMGGEAGAESTLGQGSTFWFTARLTKADYRDAPREAEALAPEEELRRRFSGRRILLVEDEPINAEIAKTFLEEADLRVETAGNGAEALARIQSGDFDAVLMDMQMPVMDGLESTRRIRALPGFDAIPIIAMTANAFAEDRERCLAVGMNDFVAKPVALEALFATLLKCLSQPARKSEVPSPVWSPEYSVGVASLDRQHRRLLGLCQAAAAITAQGEDFRSAILPILEQMRHYAQEHFRTEEALLAERGYPGLDAQKLEHQAYSDALAEFIFSASLKILDPDSVGQFLTDWWLEHILISDMAYKKYLGADEPPEPGTSCGA